MAANPCSHLRCVRHSADCRQATNAREGQTTEDAIAFATPYADRGLISTRVSAALLETLLHPAEENRRPSGCWDLPLSIISQSLGSSMAAPCPFGLGLVDARVPLMCRIHTADMANLLVEFHRTICELQRLNQHHGHGTVVQRMEVVGDLRHASASTA